MKKLQSFFMFIAGLLFGASVMSFFWIKQIGLSVNLISRCYATQQRDLQLEDDTDENVYKNIFHVCQYTCNCSDVVSYQEQVGMNLKKLAYIYWQQLVQNLTRKQKDKLIEILQLVEELVPASLSYYQHHQKEATEQVVKRDMLLYQLYEQLEQFKLALEPMLLSYSAERIKQMEQKVIAQQEDGTRGLQDTLNTLQYLHESLAS